MDIFQEQANEAILNTRPYQAGKPIEEVEREYGLTDIIIKILWHLCLNLQKLGK